MTKLWLLAVVVGTATLCGTAAAQGAAGANATAAPTCVARPNVRKMQIVDAQNILFVMRDKTTYRNALARQCPGLRRDSQISLTASDQQVCAGTNFQVLLRAGGSNSESVLLPGGGTMSVPRPSFIPGPTCTLGAFTAITEADAAALVESSRNRRRGERRGDDETEDAPQPAAPATR
jgi:hypothetical protein